MTALKTWTLATTLLLAAAGVLWAAEVVTTDLGSGQKVVQARKALMQAIKLNMADAGQKFEAGAIGAIQANGVALEAMGRVIPPLFRDRHAEVYTGTGSYFKGGAPGDFEAAAEAYRAVAAAVSTAAVGSDREAVAAAMSALPRTCSGCHQSFRGRF